MRRPTLGDRAIRHMAQTMVRDGTWTERERGENRTWKVRAQRGRPGPGEIGLIVALTRRLGLSRQVVHRALIGSPRSGSPPAAMQPLEAPDPPRPMTTSWTTVSRDLAAVGLTTAPQPPSLPQTRLSDVRQVLEEALDLTLASDVLTVQERIYAEALLRTIRPPP